MENRYKITIDLKNKSLSNVRYKQGDARSSILEISLVDGGVPVDITNQTIKFTFLRSDDTIVVQDASNGVTIIDAVAGKFQCVLDISALAIGGLVKCEISFSSGESILSTATFSFIVDTSIGVLSIKYISAVEDQIAVWQAAETTRVESETARSAAEVTRESNENQRISNEQGRVTAEDAREVAESTRVNSEDARIASENERIAAEIARAALIDSKVDKNANEIILGGKFRLSYNANLTTLDIVVIP
ncbi:MAG: BppU family phage baseplate upper protein [Bacillota bacterium]|nr:BppU family phage baseplate upper protein [Bacillota bacterium]